MSQARNGLLGYRRFLLSSDSGASRSGTEAASYIVLLLLLGSAKRQCLKIGLGHVAGQKATLGCFPFHDAGTMGKQLAVIPKGAGRNFPHTPILCSEMFQSCSFFFPKLV